MRHLNLGIFRVGEAASTDIPKIWVDQARQIPAMQILWS